MKILKELFYIFITILLFIAYESILLFGLAVLGSWLISIIPISGLLGMFLVLFSSLFILCIFSLLSILPILLFW
jgi:hypothetical protein